MDGPYYFRLFGASNQSAPAVSLYKLDTNNAS